MDPRRDPLTNIGSVKKGVSGMKRELNDAFLRTLRPPAEGRLEVWDTRVSGLVLRLTSGGAATWGVRLRTRDGKRTRPSLGAWPALGLKDARKRALATIAEVQGGGDPVAARRQAREERRAREAEATVAARLAEWQAARAARWSDRHAREVARIAEREIEPKLGKRALRATARADWTGLVAAKRTAAPAMAAAMYRVVSAFLGHAEAEGWIETALLPRKGAQRLAPAPDARQRVLTDDELAAVWRASAAEAPKCRAFVRLLILTGCRREEVASIATGEVDLAAGLWRLPGERSKNGQGRELPLGPLALAELRAVWPEHGEEAGADWRLLGRVGDPFRGFSKLKARVDRASIVADWTWHDLRRTCRTGLARLGVDRLHAERAIGHVSGQSALERVYDVHDYGAETRAALLRWQGHVAALLGEAGAVVPLRAVRA